MQNCIIAYRISILDKTTLRRTRRNSASDNEAVVSDLPPSPSLPKKSKAAEKESEKTARPSRRAKKTEETPPKDEDKDRLSNYIGFILTLPYTESA